MENTSKGARVALVTGSARGIGRAIARRLAADGLDVAVCDLDSMAEQLNTVAEEIRKTGRNSIALSADVSDAAAVDAMVERVVSELGHLDVMVANAGIVHEQMYAYCQTNKVEGYEHHISSLHELIAILPPRDGKGDVSAI